ncbi:MAG TPA: F0F1 ATP synthase subunit alpha, partial [Candidatus Omnitrophota bacterium]|nr:F0F1 ATP synthase subunit alpha [Candidatus Omnitrophota bacterium]
LSKQVLIIYAGNKGYLDEIKLELIKKFETEFLAFIEAKHAAIEHEIQTQKILTETNEKRLKEAIELFKKEFLAKHQTS